MKICTETDYLQAHLTAIVRESRHWNPAFHNLKLGNVDTEEMDWGSELHQILVSSVIGN